MSPVAQEHASVVMLGLLDEEDERFGRAAALNIRD
jgi:hypothetical protein